MGKLGVVAPLLIALTVPGFVAEQAPTDLTEAARERDRAIETLDVGAWDRLTAPGFTIVDRTGRLLTRAEQRAQFVNDRNDQPAGQPLIYIDGIRLRSASDRGEALACVDATLVLQGSGNVAIRRCATDGGSKLEVWTKTTAGWQVIAAQYTPTA
jgi:hypothetical protein